MTAAMARGDAARKEALKYSQRIIRLELKTIYSIQKKAGQAGVRPAGQAEIEPVFDETDRLNLIRCAWSIVDRLDTTRQLLKGFTLQRDELRDELFETAKALRNQMDHLGGNIKTHNSRKHSLPIYGIIMYQRSRPDDFTFDETGRAFLKKRTFQMVGLSETPKNTHLTLHAGGANYGSPVGDTYLLAFNERLCLSTAGVVADQIEKMVIEMEANVEEQLREMAESGGHEYGGRNDCVHPLTFTVAATYENAQPIDTARASELINRCW